MQCTLSVALRTLTNTYGAPFVSIVSASYFYMHYNPREMIYCCYELAMFAQFFSNICHACTRDLGKWSEPGGTSLESTPNMQGFHIKDLLWSHSRMNCSS